MDVIRHDYEGVQTHGRKMVRNRSPTFLDHAAQPVRFHLVADDSAEQTSALSGARRDEVSAVRGVVVLAKPR
jgi:hypothetical protein